MTRVAPFARVLLVFAAVAVYAKGAGAGEIGFIEEFALAPDRAGPLKQLIPGTEEFYYYHALHYQNTEQFGKVDELIPTWVQRHGKTARVQEILNRQALLTYDKSPQQSLEHLRTQLGLQFNHQREVLGKKPNLPLTLDPKIISRERLMARAYSLHTNLNGFEDAALEWLVSADLNPERRRNLIQRLARPDHEGLVKLIVADLNHEYSGGFGSLPIHAQLLTAQLEELLKLKGDLLNQQHFVNAYLTKLRPSADIDWRNDLEALGAYLAALKTFTDRLAPVHNSLKAHVLYHQLALDRRQGKYDKDRFMEYVKLPRHVGYMNPKFLALEESRKHPADLNANYEPFTQLPIVGDDQPLVREYLMQFFIKETTYKPYETYINDVYLKHVFAETKIVNGLGDPEQWYSLLPPETYQALKERIDIDFAATNKKFFAADEAVSLDLFVKNAASLVVKVFEINTQNFYRQNLREIDTDINLDGLVANEEKTHTYAEPALRRVARHFDFPTLTKPGVYVIDFIGNGKSSRVLVRKGKLRYLVRSSTAGQVFTVLDEKNQKLPKAALWLSGQLYSADKDGVITVPYSNQPGRQAIVLQNGSFCSLDHFQHEGEGYSLAAGIHVDREALLARKKVQVVVRPALYMNGTPVTLKVLEEVKLVISSTDLDGVASTKEVGDFKLFEDRESVYEFQTPQRLAKIGFQLKAKVKVLSTGAKVDLAVQETFALNEIDRTEKVEDLHFANLDGTYVIELLGKTGESKADRPVQVSLKHRDFKEPATASLQTNPQGRVVLGELPGIVSVTATGPEGVTHTWNLLRDEHRYRQTLHAKAGQVLRVPYLGSQKKPIRAEVSLLELRDGTFVTDKFAELSIEDGFLKIAGLARGDYDLFFKEQGVRILIRVGEGEVRDGYVLGDIRQLEVRGATPLHIEKVEAEKENITVKLQNSSKFARVHVFATRYQPAYSSYANLGRVVDAEPYLLSVARAESLYAAGRNIGDEYRYILDRKHAAKFPGNTLERPSLLLNPWAIRKTETAQQIAQGGDDFGGQGKGGGTGSGRFDPKPIPPPQLGDFADLDFLAQTSAVLVNLVPDEKGVVEIERAALGPHQQIHIVAVDPTSTTYRTLALPEVKSSVLDMRLSRALDAKLHYTQQKQVSVVGKGNVFTLPDISSSKFEAYDSLARVYSLYATLSHDPKLIEFSFVLGWHQLKPEEKRAKYSKYACHELSFFLYKKDPEFFKTAVKPYLKNKQHKTFMDRWLLDEELGDYLLPWNYAQLNMAERALLAQRLAGQHDVTARHIKDLYDLIPVNLEQRHHLFKTALQGSALDAGDAFGFDKAQDDATKLKELEEAKPREPRAEEPAAPAPAKPGDSAPATDSPAKRPGGGPAPGAGAPPPKTSEQAGKSEKATEAGAKKKADGKYDEAFRRMRDKSRGEGKEAKDADEADDFLEADRERRTAVRQLFRQLDKTQEWVENNYYNLAIEVQNADLVPVSAFWRDYAQHDPAKPFYSVNLAEAGRNFPEMMFALSLLDLPFEPGKHETKFDGLKMSLTTGSPMVVFHEEIREAKKSSQPIPILVSQNFFRHGDRHRMVDNEQVDKYVTDEFLVHTVYGCQVVVTNPTSSRQKLDVLLQIPLGAMPVINGQATRSLPVDLPPFHTQTVDYYFYFPLAGKFPHYPVQVSKNEALLASAEPVTLSVVNEPSKIDKESWDYISQFGSEDDVLAYLKAHNLHNTNLDKIAFRMADARFFQTVIDLLAARHVYNHTLWSYGIRHNVVAAVREFLQHSDGFLAQCGAYLDSKLVTIDPVIRKTYQHMDYKPLVNARAHQLGRRRQILNDRFDQQYNRLLAVLSCRRDLSSEDQLAVTYYLLLQDRIAEALATFEKVDVAKIDTRLQYDYFAAYLDLFTDDHKIAKGLAEKYASHPVDRWRNAFVSVRAQLDEIEGAPVKLVDVEDRNQQQTGLAASEVGFEFKVESKQVSLTYQNLDEVTVNYYLMDIELLFSRNPFVQQYAGQFSHIRPNGSQVVKLPEKEKSFKFDLPEQLHNSNVLIEIIGGGQTKQQAYYSHSLAIQTIENYGQVRVTHGKTGQPAPKTYVKVYAQMQDGTTRFYKDGYTDLRGRFDYGSLSTNELDFVKKFSLLIFSDENGAVVREANPPKR